MSTTPPEGMPSAEEIVDAAIVKQRDRDDTGERLTLEELIRDQGFDPEDFDVR